MTKITILNSSVLEALVQVDMLKGLTPKESNCLRLLTEEMFSLCKELLKLDLLDFEIRSTEKEYTLWVCAQSQMDEKAREQLFTVSSSGKNAANKGVRGMVGAVLELLATSYESTALLDTPWSYGMNIQSNENAYTWSLSQYMDTAPDDEIKKEWDGMEKSIIANFSDDVSIGVRNGKIEMKITKIF